MSLRIMVKGFFAQMLCSLNFDRYAMIHSSILLKVNQNPWADLEIFSKIYQLTHVHFQRYQKGTIKDLR